MTKSVLLCILSAACLTNVMAAGPTSPYVGQQTREIKALAPDDVEAYLSGQGMGFAKAAELNGYPGPAHVLTLAAELQLTPDQERRTRALFDDMQARARSLGRILVAQERTLNEQFASKAITQESLTGLLKSIGDLQTQIRQTHLETHLAQLAILTPSQAAKYNELRGYVSDTRHADHEHMH